VERWEAGEGRSKDLERVGGQLRSWWDAAWALHAWGFHEAKFDPEDVKVRLPDVERIVLEARRAVEVSR
jgi:hypothetical protein